MKRGFKEFFGQSVIELRSSLAESISFSHITKVKQPLFRWVNT